MNARMRLIWGTLLRISTKWARKVGAGHGTLSGCAFQRGHGAAPMAPNGRRDGSLQGEIQLPPCLVDGDGDGIGQVQATAVGTHGQAQTLLVGQCIANFGWQAAAFRAEQEGVAALEPHLMEGLRALGGEGEQARLAEARQAAVQIGMPLERSVLVIIEAGTAQALVVQLEAQWFDQMQTAAGIGAEPDNVAGIRRNLRLKKDYMIMLLL